MNLIQLCIEKRVTVLVGVTFMLLFGWIGLQRMPYQLSPTVVEPEISVTTTWPGATPYEVERDIIEEQEKVLKGIPGLIEMESTSSNSQGTVTLKFAIGTDLNSALLRVSNKLDEVPSYPENVDKPIITATGAATSPVVWMVLKTAEGTRPPPTPTGPFSRTTSASTWNEPRGWRSCSSGAASKRSFTSRFPPSGWRSTG
jgi:hydrophobic/amphiphilic exporter-1 (mainly G- bacteria), HAE1 family